MTVAEFIAKWSRFSGKEMSAYQEHFNDLCRVLAHPNPVESDPTGAESFCFQKRVVKDAELFGVMELFDEYTAAPAERGFADVWKKGHFAWEYKGPGKDLEAAYRQLLRYREALLNPPLLAVCDFQRIIVRTNFNGAVQQTYDIPLAKLDTPDNLRVLRALFFDPDSLRPDRTARQVTEELAARIGDVARSLQKRESVELRDARTRQEHRVGYRKNLRVAQFLNRITFCLFAEDVGLLPKGLFGEITAAGLEDGPSAFSEGIEDLFRAMSDGGRYGPHRIRHFNGDLFKEATVFELTADEIAALAAAAAADWQSIEPSIFGTLFQRALDEEHRAQLGAHYTSPEDIRTLLEPVLMAPLRGEWMEIKRGLLADYRVGKASPKARKALEAFLKRLQTLVVLDPACGSGNFLYLSLQLLLDLEKQVVAFAATLGLELMPGVDGRQLRAIEINPYAYELAQVSVQIGYLQWMRANGFTLDRTPVLQKLGGFECADALMREAFGVRPTSLQDAQDAEHTDDAGVKAYNERLWPKCDVIVGNPPFLGGNRVRQELGSGYVNELLHVFYGRVPGTADLCCYWFEKARAAIAEGTCKRAGLLATQGIRGGANREVLNAIKKSGNIFFAESDRPWILDGASVHVSMVGFDDGTEKTQVLDGHQVPDINSNLTSATDAGQATVLRENAGIGFIGVAQKAPFDIEGDHVLTMLSDANPHGRPNSDVLVPIRNASDLTQGVRGTWNIDFGLDMPVEQASLYTKPFAYVEKVVHPIRKDHREARQVKYWWLFARPCPDMRLALSGLPRFAATPRVSKHRLVVWLTPEVLCDSAAVAFARADDLFFGVLHSRIHEVWALRMGTRLETRPRYTPSTCFETFAFPEGVLSASDSDAVFPNISAAAKELNELRENWLNPPEWTRTEVMEFPGTVGGPWDRYIDPATVEERRDFKIGTVRYPRIVARDAECAARLKDRTLTKLYNARPTWLDLAHRTLDAAVAAAYGWPADLADDAILERLLALNVKASLPSGKTSQDSALRDH